MKSEFQTFQWKMKRIISNLNNQKQIFVDDKSPQTTSRQNRKSNKIKLNRYTE